MTVCTTMIAQVSEFTVGDTGSFTETDYDQYSIWAKEELDRDDPRLPTSKYDEAHANLICDIFVSSKGGRNFKSEKIGDYGYTKDSGGNGGKSSYRLRYEEILKQFAGEQPTAGQERIDIETPSDFQLDQLGLVEFNTDDDLE